MRSRRAHWLTGLLIIGCNGGLVEGGSGSGTTSTTGEGPTATEDSSASSSTPSTGAGETSSGSTAPETSGSSSAETTSAGSSTSSSSTTGTCCELDGVPCTNDCEPDFTGFQLYCAGTCSPDGVDGCTQGDADLLCRLTLRSATAVAVMDWSESSASDGPGFFVCPGPNTPECTTVGPFPEWGVDQELCMNLISIKDLGGATIVNPNCVDG